MFANLYQRIVGTPWVYDRLRPWLFGGWDFAPVYKWLEIKPNDAVIDVGCGTGATMDYVAGFDEYHGFDIDPRALEAFRSRYPQPNIHLHANALSAADVRAIQPTKAILMGLLHHLADDEVDSLLGALAQAPTLQRIITLDPERIAGDWINGLVIRLDRGKFVRSRDRYLSLVQQHFAVREFVRLTTGNKAAKFFAMCIQGASANSRGMAA